jgi:16S rRNA processing protein RimM
VLFVSDSYISVGKISGVFGHRGWVKVLIYSGRPDRFEGIKVVYFKNKEDYQAQILTGIQFHGKNVLLKFKHADDRETAKSLNNLEIFLPETEKIALPEDHFFIHDIIGSQVFDEAGQSVGEVKEVIAAGSSDVFVVRSDTKEVLIPAVAEFVLSVDLKNNRIVVRLWEEM